MEFFTGTEEKTIRRKAYYQGHRGKGGEIIDLSVTVTGEHAGRLLEIAEVMLEKYFEDAKRELEKVIPEPTQDVVEYEKIHYLCNGEREGCGKKICYKTNDGSELAVCRHTQDIRYAENFKLYGQTGYWEDIQKSIKDEDADTKKQ